MTETQPSTAAWIADRRTHLSAFQRVQRLQQMDDAKEAVADQRAELARQAAASDRLEALSWAAHQGDPLGSLRRWRVEAEEVDGEFRDLTARLEALTARRTRLSECIEDAQRQVSEVTASVSRAAPSQDLLAEAKERLAEERVSRMLAAAQARPPERRPFAGGGADAECGPDCPVCAKGRRRDAERHGGGYTQEITRVCDTAWSS